MIQAFVNVTWYVPNISQLVVGFTISYTGKPLLGRTDVNSDPYTSGSSVGGKPTSTLGATFTFPDFADGFSDIEASSNYAFVPGAGNIKAFIVATVINDARSHLLLDGEPVGGTEFLITADNIHVFGLPEGW